MTRLVPDQEWWTADELASSGLPDMPATKRGINMTVDRLNWRAYPKFARRRAGRGGGWEYHWKLFPQRAQAALLKAAQVDTGESESQMDRGEAWAWFDGLPEKVKAKARDRLKTIQFVEELEGAVGGRHMAVEMVGRRVNSAPRTIWYWFEMIEGIERADRLPYLAPRHRASRPKRKKAECSQEFLNWLRADYLRLGEPSFNSCYARVADLCEKRGLSVLQPRTARRWIDQNIPRVTQVFARLGEAGLSKCFPPQIRDRNNLTAMEAVNADCHKIDVFVQWPGIEKPVRPQIVAFQDLYSNKVLAWRVDLDPNKVAVMSAFGELIETWGIPKHCLFDNGREFANKWLTGGAPTRFRFKMRDDDPLGVLPMLDIQVHWATPAHGQAKPIERGFRDLADHIAKDPRFAGAYVGNRPDAKPENYGSRAVPLEDFLRVLNEGIQAHNARQGRLSSNARGRSFDETFAESYAEAPIRKATAEQHRLWLMGQEVRKLHSNHGGLTLHKNGYWADWMNEYAGERVVARFNPEDLHEGVYIYALDGEFLGTADCREKVGFFDLVGAKLHAKRERQRRKAEKQLLDAMRPVSVEDFAAELDAAPRPDTPLVEAKVVEIAPARRQKGLIHREMPVPDASEASDRQREALVMEFRRAERDAEAPKQNEETAKDRFRRALDIEARSEAGQPVGEAEARWHAIYSNTPEYTRQRMFLDDFGESALR
ncbi:transposase domain-containing protein [Paracoccus onubensis]|uniref:Transposase n=1 Tax=Paracoccus onubensis TaxID=1675788 RepID=A0A418T1N3_9RHOB|nr:transposase domain-containing protein [Paracoccus onubensis]RJE87109.1 transposase [Paracoccus onubensis]